MTGRCCRNLHETQGCVWQRCIAFCPLCSTALSFSQVNLQAALKSCGCKSTTIPPLHLRLTRRLYFSFSGHPSFCLWSLYCRLASARIKAHQHVQSFTNESSLITIYSWIPSSLFPPCIKLPRRLAQKSEEIWRERGETCSHPERSSSMIFISSLNIHHHSHNPISDPCA